MQVHSIISNTISEEILSSGHLSIRFMTDGFSLLIQDKEFRPVVLNRFHGDADISLNSYVLSCSDWLERHTLLDGFKGEISIVIDLAPETLVPESLFSEKNASAYLAPVCQLKPGDSVRFRQIRNRPFYIVFAVPHVIVEFARHFSNVPRILTSTEVSLSVADQVNAADHQRGFAMIETQNCFINILLIRDDQLVLSNHLRLKNQEELVYHTLNTLQQMEFDRKNSPLFFTGCCNENEIKTLSRYIRNIKALSYHILDIEKSSIPEHVILAEASRCG